MFQKLNNSCSFLCVLIEKLKVYSVSPETLLILVFINLCSLIKIVLILSKLTPLNLLQIALK